MVRITLVARGLASRLRLKHFQWTQTQIGLFMSPEGWLLA